MTTDERTTVETEHMRHVSRVKVLTDYLDLKRETKDWHGVEDAASDIRDLYAKIETLQWVLDTVGNLPATDAK